jgi:hypothetical protein
MSKKQLIHHVANENDKVLKVVPTKDDPTTLELEALAVGCSELSLTDDKNTEKFSVGVKPRK